MVMYNSAVCSNSHFSVQLQAIFSYVLLDMQLLSLALINRENRKKEKQQIVTLEKLHLQKKKKSLAQLFFYILSILYTSMFLCLIFLLTVYWGVIFNFSSSLSKETHTLCRNVLWFTWTLLYHLYRTGDRTDITNKAQRDKETSVGEAAHAQTWYQSWEEARD